MDNSIQGYCSTCFALPGELCRTKFIVHGRDEITPVICPTHNGRPVEGHEDHTKGRSSLVDSMTGV